MLMATMIGGVDDRSGLTGIQNHSVPNNTNAEESQAAVGPLDLTPKLLKRAEEVRFVDFASTCQLP